MSVLAQSKSKIFVVEDESIIAHDIADKLQRAGYELAGIADSSNSAISGVRTSSPDLILMDIHIRGALDGIETACQIQEFTKVPVVFLTAHADHETLERAKGAIPYGYLSKPIRGETLFLTIETALNHWRHECEQREGLRIRALNDQLTGLPNRRALFERYPDGPSDRPETLIVCLGDLDHFKLINDGCGHAEGDRVLRVFSRVLIETIDDHDFGCRVGGDEFFIVFGDGNDERVLRCLEEVRTRFARESSDRYTATCSLGACYWPAGASTTEALKLADASLYQAKARGGNYVSARLLAEVAA